MGNHDDIQLMTLNACRILEWAKVSNVRVYSGEAKPLVKCNQLSTYPPQNGPYKELGGKLCHGENGLGNVLFPVPTNTELIDTSLTASDFIIKKCTENPGEISIITLGPVGSVIATSHESVDDQFGKSYSSKARPK